MGTKIEWTDETWNPVTGCTKVSSGCDNCYAESIAHRFAGTAAYPDGFDVSLRPERLDQPLRWRRPRRIFVNSMSDLFHADIPDEYIARVFGVMALATHHTFQILTKRPGRMRSFLKRCADAEGMGWITHNGLPVDGAYAERGTGGIIVGDANQGWPLPNVWLGVSVEDQKWADVRIPVLLDTPAAVRFLSCEPLLGPVNLRQATSTVRESQRLDAGQIGWVIVGGESGTGARPMHPGWARSLRGQCTTFDIPFLFKQWGSWIPTTAPGDEGDMFHQLDGVLMRRVGKKAAGRVLDGRTWDEYPAVL